MEDAGRRKRSASAMKAKVKTLRGRRLREPAAEEPCLADGLSALPHTCLEAVACCLDTPAGLRLYRVNRAVQGKLLQAAKFWKRLCYREKFHEFHTLLKEDPSTGPVRLAHCGAELHGAGLPEGDGYWRRVWLRGLEMRRNVARGTFQLWRLFMTDGASLPVKEMKVDTSFRELRSRHRGCALTDPRRRVRVQRYWNEDYLVVIQHTLSHQFNDIFVWKWDECQNPEFQYSTSLSPLYPTGLFPTAFFLWKQYFVLMPETGYIPEERRLCSMIRTHDLSAGFRLHGRYDFPESGAARRILRIGVNHDEAAHLHQLGEDKAVALCRTPKHCFYIFSLPDCHLLRTVPIVGGPGTLLPSLDRLHDRPLEQDDLDQRFLVKDDTMMFLFHHPDFFNDIFEINEDGPVRHGRLLVVDFKQYLKDGGQVQMMLDPVFDSSDDYVEKVCIVSPERLLCVSMAGSIALRTRRPWNLLSAPGEHYVRFWPQLIIPCPEPLKENYEPGQEVDTDGPNLVTSRAGDLIAVLRHFLSGRKVHCYTDTGALLYTILVDCAGLEPRPGYLSLDLDGAFLCAADQGKVVIWNSRTGAHVNTIAIPEHYNYRDDPEESADRFCWKGHTDFAFTEDGIIVIHSQRNFPVAADVFLFW